MGGGRGVWYDKRMVLNGQVIRMGFCAAVAACAAAGAEDTLEAQFVGLSQNATRPSVALTLGMGQRDTEAFLRQLERAREAGAGGVLVTVPTADEAVWGLLAKGAGRCRQLGLELGVRDFGLSTQEVASAAHLRKLVWSAYSADASEGLTNTRPQVFQTNRSYQELARLAVPLAERVQPCQMVDLTQGPMPTSGVWRVAQFGHAEVMPMTLDCLDERQVSQHVNGLLCAFQKRLERTYGTTFLWVQMEGLSGTEWLWPRDLPAVFLKRSGVGLMRHLPALTGVAAGDEAMAAHVRVQVAQTVRELWRSRYAGQVNELVHEAGLDAGIGVDGLPVDPEEVALYFKRPLLASARSEAQRVANIRASGGARATGRRLVVGQVDTASVAATAAAVLLPFPCKHEVDRLLCAGATRILFEIGGALSGGDEPFAALRDACRYAHRCQVMLQQGEAAADFLVWSQELLPVLDGYGCDYANQTMLETAVAKAGRIQFDSGRTYGALVVSAERLKSKAAQQLTRQFEARGVIVWVVGGESEAAAGGAEPVGKPLRVATDCGILPDFEWQSEGEAMRVRFVHRRVPECEFYFVANTAEAGGPVICTFRDAGKGVAERWNPVSGEVSTLAQGVRAADGRVTIPLFLAPHDACFIVFDRGSPEAAGFGVQGSGHP
ncbi:MAG: glycosyl hydrolase [bacterium]